MHMEWISGEWQRTDVSRSLQFYSTTSSQYKRLFKQRGRFSHTIWEIFKRKLTASADLWRQRKRKKGVQLLQFNRDAINSCYWFYHSTNNASLDRHDQARAIARWPITKKKFQRPGVLQIRVRYNLILAENAHSAQGQTGDGQAEVMAGRMAARSYGRQQTALLWYHLLVITPDSISISNANAYLYKVHGGWVSPSAQPVWLPI